MNEQRLQRLVDESDIREVVLRYCRAIDRIDEDLLRSCYHDDATDSHAGFEGTADEFVAWVMRLLPRYLVTMHFVGNVLLDWSSDPDVAQAETYAIAFHRSEDPAPKRNLVTAFRYLDRFERRSPGDGAPPEWRIARRVVITEWVSSDDRERWWPIPEGLIVGQRDGTDLVFEWKRDG